MRSNPANPGSGVTKCKPSISKADSREEARPKKMIGIGMFRSGVSDLATNKKYMEGFGQSSMGVKHKPKQASPKKARG
jgi:hypothetical protein